MRSAPLPTVKVCCPYRERLLAVATVRAGAAGAPGKPATNRATPVPPPTPLLPTGPGHEPLVFVGRTDGRIVPARGPSDFG